MMLKKLYTLGCLFTYFLRNYIYVPMMRVLKRCLAALGIMSYLEKHKDNPLLFYIRSLFAIYDIDDLIKLDLAWWNFEAIDYVNNFLNSRKEARIFEYGSGASTIWLAKRSHSITTVEHNEKWSTIVLAAAKNYPNITLKLRPATTDGTGTVMSRDPLIANYRFDNYVPTIDETDELYDLIVVDGMCRNACLTYALKHLKPDGILLFDNSNHSYYSKAIDASGYVRKDFFGLTPSMPYPTRTTIILNQMTR